MKKNVIILVAVSNEEYFQLIKQGLHHADIRNGIVRFEDGQDILDFLFSENAKFNEIYNQEYLLLLDVNMPTIDGIKVLEKIKQDKNLKKMPVIMLSSADDNHLIERCHSLGCSTYIEMSEKKEDFTDAIEKIGQFLSFVEMPLVTAQ